MYNYRPMVYATVYTTVYTSTTRLVHWSTTQYGFFSQNIFTL